MTKRKLKIKNVVGTHGGLSPMLLVDTSDGYQYAIPRSGVSRAEFRNATIAVLVEGKKIISIAKVRDLEKKDFKYLMGKPLELDGSEKIVDCRGKKSE